MILIGLAPALRTLRIDMADSLRAGARAMGPGSGRTLRSGVAIAEVALSFVLLIGSGLLARSFLALLRVDPGFDSRGVLTFLLLGGDRGDTPLKRAAATQAIHQRLGTLRGVQSVTASTPFPLAGGFSTIRWGTEQALTDPSKFRAVEPQIVLPGYFETLRTRLIAGRTFAEADNSPSRSVVVVDELLAAKAFPGESAIGKRLLIRFRTPQPEWVEVIGVAAHQRTVSLSEVGREQIYLTDGFSGHGAVSRWAVRATGDPEELAVAIKSELKASSPGSLLTEMQPMDALVARAQAKTRFSMLLLGVFGAVSAILAAVGLFGVLSTMVEQRTAELGVRMALGAEPIGLFKLVVTYGLRLTVAGIVIGCPLALWISRSLRTLLIGIAPADPGTYVAVGVLFLIIGAVSACVPAWRASTLGVMAAIRRE